MLEMFTTERIIKVKNSCELRHYRHDPIMI